VDDHEEGYYRWLRERTTTEIIRQATAAGIATMIHSGPVPGYPPGYRDPDWGGTETGFRAVVEVRADALAATASSLLPSGLEFSWGEIDTARAGAERPGAPHTHVYPWEEVFAAEPTAGERPAPGRGGLTLTAVAFAGDSHIWVSEPLPATCAQVTIGGYDNETHPLDQTMIQGQDGPGRDAVWLETTLRRTWPTGTTIAVAAAG
jgi:hypothetical protein